MTPPHTTEGKATVRTDEMTGRGLRQCWSDRLALEKFIEFARQLERELNQAQRDLATAKETISEQVKEIELYNKTMALQ